MSYEIAATGLNAVNEQLDGISNNIANAGTVGYKSMTTQFSAMYAGSRDGCQRGGHGAKYFARRFAGLHRQRAGSGD